MATADKGIGTSTVLQWMVYALFVVMMAAVGFGVRSIQGDVTQIRSELKVFDDRQRTHLAEHPSHQLRADMRVAEERIEALTTRVRHLEQ